jgi:hypothetical protein
VQARLLFPRKARLQKSLLSMDVRFEFVRIVWIKSIPTSCFEITFWKIRRLEELQRIIGTSMALRVLVG